MNWKKGFQRLAVLVSAAVLLVGLVITVEGAISNYDEYKRYKEKSAEAVKLKPLAKRRLTIDTGFNPDEFFARSQRRIRYLSELEENSAQTAEVYRSQIVPGLLYGVFATIAVAAIPWALFGTGLYLVRGFRNP